MLLEKRLPRHAIITEQMQCPGMPLEHHHIFAVKRDKAQCILTEHLNKNQIDMSTGRVTAFEPVAEIHTKHG